MKRTLLLLSILLFLGSCNSNITPDGRVIKETVEVKTFTTLDVSSGIEVEFSQSDKDSVVVETYESVMPYLNVTNLGNSLKISLDDNCPYDNIPTLKVKIRAQELTIVNATENSHIVVLTDITSTNFEILLDEGSSFSMENDKTLTVTSSLLATLENRSKCTISGTSERFIAGLTEWSSFSTFDFSAEDIEVKVNMGSLMEISVSKSYLFIADGASTIRYKGNAKGTSHASGGSKIVSL